MAEITQSMFHRFWKLLKNYNKEVSHIYIYGIINGIVYLSLPLGTQAIVSFLQIGELTSSWIFLVIFVIGGIGLSGYLQVMQLRVVENIQQDIFVRSSMEFAYRLPNITYEAFNRYHAPEVANRFFDTMTIQKGLPKILIDFSLALFQIVFGIILLIIYSPYFVILPFILFVTIWIMYSLTGLKGFNASITVSKYKYKVAHWLEEIARVRKVFKLNVKAKLHMTQNDKISTSYVDARQNLFSILLKQYGFLIFLKVAIVTVLLVLGGILVFNNQMNIGQFVAAEIIVIMVVGSFEKIITLIDTIYDVLTGLEKIGFVTDMELDSKKGVKADADSKVGVSVKATDIAYAFPGAKRNRLTKISFEAKAHDRVLVKGETGKGKSVLLHLLSGLYQATQGEIFIDDIPIENYRPDELLNQTGFLTDTNDLFEGTVINNISMGRQYSKDYLEEILDELFLRDFIKSLPLGLDTPIDSGGRRLPNSVVQKLQLAREILTEPRLLLIEELMMAITRREKEAIIDYLSDKIRPWTLFVVSEDPYWAEHCQTTIQL